MAIIKSYVINKPLEDVYHAWVSEQHIVTPATSLKIEPKVDGIYQLIAKVGEHEATMTGHFTKVLENNELEYTWEWNSDGERSVVNVKFTPDEEGTIVDIVHSGLASENAIDMHSQGWDSYIEGLKKII